MPNTNTSATGGYLAPLSTSVPTEDAALDAQLQAMVVGIVGLDDSLVRPRWQPTDPKQPDRSIDWCAIGIVSMTPNANASIVHVSYADINDPNTHDEMQRHEMLEILASFYGPNSYSNAALLRDGLSIGQNREVMSSQGMGFVESVNAVNTSELINQGWVRRADFAFRIRRIVIREYPILNIVEAPGTVSSDDGAFANFDANSSS